MYMYFKVELLSSFTLNFAVITVYTCAEYMEMYRDTETMLYTHKIPGSFTLLSVQIPIPDRNLYFHTCSTPNVLSIGFTFPGERSEQPRPFGWNWNRTWAKVQKTLLVQVNSQAMVCTKTCEKRSHVLWFYRQGNTLFQTSSAVPGYTNIGQNMHPIKESLMTQPHQIHNSTHFSPDVNDQ